MKMRGFFIMDKSIFSNFYLVAISLKNIIILFLLFCPFNFTKYYFENSFKTIEKQYFWRVTFSLIILLVWRLYNFFLGRSEFKRIIKKNTVQYHSFFITSWYRFKTRQLTLFWLISHITFSCLIFSLHFSIQG